MTEASEEDGMTKELRRLNEEKSSKMDNDKKAKEKK